MPHDEDRYIEYDMAGWLRQKRRALELTQEAIGAAVGVHKVAVHHWETGATSPSHSAPGTFARWKAWAKAVNCRLEITLVDTNGERHDF
jgi:transcriptional regulator with XRE-family HTH domain